MAHAQADTPAAAVPRDAASASVADLDRDHLVHPLSELRRDQDVSTPQAAVAQGTSP